MMSSKYWPYEAIRDFILTHPNTWLSAGQDGEIARGLSMPKRKEFDDGRPRFAPTDNIGGTYIRRFIREVESGKIPGTVKKSRGQRNKRLVYYMPPGSKVVLSTTTEEIRAAMGTLPAMRPKREDELYHNLEHLHVKLVDYPINPYKAIFNMVTSTWGDRESWKNRWANVSPENRMKVVIAALERKTLRQGLECGSWTFLIQGCSRGAFDQLARHRMTGIGSVGSRDNCHRDAALIVPPKLWDTMSPALRDRLTRWWFNTKYLYDAILSMKEGKETWQNARFILPMGMEWRFTWTMNTRALWDSIMPQRLSFCEQFDTVTTVWLMWHRIHEKFPLLAAHLRPACDWAHKCTYADKYKLSEFFGCLFKPCPRYIHTVEEGMYATFNESSTDEREIAKLLGLEIPAADQWPMLVELGIKEDRHFFEEG